MLASTAFTLIYFNILIFFLVINYSIYYFYAVGEIAGLEIALVKLFTFKILEALSKKLILFKAFD